MSDGIYAEEGEYKGFPTITIYTGKEYQGKKEYVTLGLRKAAAICDCIDSIRKFVDRQENPRGR
jgi:hypothetical protein